MTLNGLKGHFTLYVHYYELPLTNYLLLIYCSLFITRVTNTCDQRRSAEYYEYLEYTEKYGRVPSLQLGTVTLAAVCPVGVCPRYKQIGVA